MFTKFYEENQTKVSKYVRKRIYNRSDCPDIEQAIWLKFWNSMDKLQDSKNPIGFLMTIARNKCIDHLRGSKSVERLGDADVAGQFRFDTDSKELKAKIIGRLPARYKRLFNLLSNGHTYQEMATKLDLPIGTIKSRVFALRDYIIENLQDLIKDLQDDSR